MYVRAGQGMRGLGATGDWWEVLTNETKIRIQNWIVDVAARAGAPLNVSEMQAAARAALRASGTESPRITAEMIASRVLRMILEGYARPVADGGGFVVGEARAGYTGLYCLCPSNTPAGRVDPVTGTTLPPPSDAAPLANGRCPAGYGGVPVSAPMMYTAPIIPHFVPSTTTGIAGRVVDASGAPVAGATIWIPPFTRAATAADGRFSIVRKAGTYSLSVSKAGYQDVPAFDVTVTSGGVTTLSDVVLLVAGAVDEERDEGLPRCPPGTALDPATGACVSAEAPPDCADPANAWMVECGGSGTYKVEEPWYKSPWVWVAGGLVLLAGGYAVYKATR